MEQMKGKINPLTNDVNKTVERIQNLTIEKLFQSAYTGLNQWRSDMLKSIDDIYGKKMKEIEVIWRMNVWKFDEHKHKQLQTMMELQGGVKQLVDDGDVAFEQIKSFENQLRQIETDLLTFEKNFLSIDIQVLDEGLITISCKVNETSKPVERRQRIVRARQSTFHFS